MCTSIHISEHMMWMLVHTNCEVSWGKVIYSCLCLVEVKCWWAWSKAPFLQCYYNSLYATLHRVGLEGGGGHHLIRLFTYNMQTCKFFFFADLHESMSHSKYFSFINTVIHGYFFWWSRHLRNCFTTLFCKYSSVMTLANGSNTCSQIV